MSSELSHWSTITNEFEPAIDPGLDTAHLDYDTVPTPAPFKQKRQRVSTSKKSNGSKRVIQPGTTGETSQPDAIHQTTQDSQSGLSSEIPNPRALLTFHRPNQAVGGTLASSRATSEAPFSIRTTSGTPAFSRTTTDTLASSRTTTETRALGCTTTHTLASSRTTADNLASSRTNTSSVADSRSILRRPLTGTPEPLELSHNVQSRIRSACSPDSNDEGRSAEMSTETANAAHQRLQDQLLVSTRSNTLDFDGLQKALQGFQPTFQLSNKLLERAQQLMKLPEEARLLAILLLIVNMAPSPLLVQHSSAGVHVSTTESWEFSKSFNTTIQTYIRSILVRDNIEAYGRKAARKYHLSKSPFGMVKDWIKNEPAAFQAKHLPPNYQGNQKFLSRLDKFIGDLVKSEKNSFGALLKVPNSPKCVPKLWSIIADVFAVIDDGHKYASAADINKDRRITPYVKAQIAYLRCMINANRISHLQNPNAKHPTFWDEIDADLHRRRSLPPVYHAALCQLLLDNKRAIWTGKKTINEVSFSDQCLPSDEAIEAQVQKMTHSNSDLSREEDDHFNFEVQDHQSTHHNIRPDEDEEESGSSSGESQSDD
ncbi:hypothetical protein PSTT_12855 [Puccinia striiformis]|uniref:Uncharacterized protein n=1 Tax=Puccinia striiformis TaxID=27350 RepID=A0A2S4UU88_9BASI|nr:hypothetical protein PSTT_12855 [Puccinia striiformis]